MEIGIKTINKKTFCANCEIEVSTDFNYCPNCSNPLKIDSSIKRSNDDLEIIDNFIRQVIESTNDQSITVEKALKEVRASYEEE